MSTAFETLLIVGIAICASHLITAFFENLAATAVLILYLAALIFLVALIITFQWYTTNFNQQRQFGRLKAETETMESGTRSSCMAQRAYDRKHASRSQRLWQEEQRRNLEEFRRRHEHTSSTSAMQAVFTTWRQDCRTLLQTPELITDMPRLPCLPCPKGYCNFRSIHTGVCSHRLRKLYETLQLEEKELKDELRFWHPDGAKVNQVGTGYRQKVLQMADEIAYVLQEILKDV